MGQALGSDGQAMGRAFGAVMAANPERSMKTLVINAPSWFNLMWKLVAPHLAESTRAKVQASGACFQAVRARWVGVADTCPGLGVCALWVWHAGADGSVLCQGGAVSLAGWC